MALVDADAPRCLGEAREEPREEEALQVERDVEGVGCEQRPSFLELPPAGAQPEVRARFIDGPPVEDEQAVDVGIRFEQCARGRAREPGDLGVRREPPEVVHDGRRMQDVADGAQADDEDAGPGWERG